MYFNQSLNLETLNSEKRLEITEKKPKILITLILKDKKNA